MQRASGGNSTWTARFTLAVIVVAFAWTVAVVSQAAGIAAWVAIVVSLVGLAAAVAVTVPQRRATGTVTRAVSFLTIFAGANVGFAVSLTF